MEGNLETVLSAVRKVEYRSPISLQKLIYFNSLARSRVFRSYRELPKELEVRQVGENIDWLNRFSLHSFQLFEVSHLREEERPEVLGAGRQS